MNGIEEITIGLLCGCCKDVVQEQTDALRPLEHKYKVFWNNRKDRHPEAYNSYSELINDTVATSPTEFVIIISDRTVPKVNEVEKILELLQSGFAMATQYSTGFMGFSKQLIRKIGWWDERFIGGGYEDDDWVLRLRLANLAYYESEEATYDKSWVTPLRPKSGESCKLSYPWFIRKWLRTGASICRIQPEEDYLKYAGKLGDDRPDIERSWKNWSHSVIGVMFKERMIDNNGGESRTKWFLRDDYKTEFRKVTSI